MKRTLPQLLYRSIAALLCLLGLIGTFNAYAPGRQFTLFANWSALLCLLVWLMLIIRPAGFACLQGMAAMCSMTTIIFSHFVLPVYSPSAHTAYQQQVDIIIRTVIPLLMLGDFLLLRTKSPLPRYAPLLWCIFPIAYFVLALQLPVLNQTLSPLLPKYPYFFLNPNGGWILRAKQGYAGVYLNAAAILAVYLLAGAMLRGAYERRPSGLICYRLLALMLCLYGQLGAFGVLSGRLNPGSASYFTHLSNCLCCITWVLLIWKPTGFARLHGFAAQAILLTMFVYHALLSHFDFRINSIAQFNDHVVHTFVPLLMVTDYLFLRRRAKLRWYTPFLWTLAPLGYCLYIHLMPLLKSTIYPSGVRYPYFFVDPSKGWLLPAPQGTVGLLLNYALIACMYIIAGYGMCGVHQAVTRLKRKKQAA